MLAQRGGVRFIGNHGVARLKLAALLGELGGLGVPGEGEDLELLGMAGNNV